MPREKAFTAGMAYGIGDASEVLLSKTNKAVTAVAVEIIHDIGVRF